MIGKFAGSLWLAGCCAVLAIVSLPACGQRLPLDQLQLPPGFRITIFSTAVPNARSMTLGKEGTVFVGSRHAGKVYALVDADQDGKAERSYVIAQGLRMPNGVAFRAGSLYVAEIHRILRFDNIEKSLANPPPPVVVYDQYPRESHHGWKHIAFGPDGALYVPVGAPCNICEPGDPYASITRLEVDGGKPSVYVRGVRNSVGFDWHPQTKEMWFTDNGRDMLGDDVPDCEINRVPKAGAHFGYPYCHAVDVSDPEFGGQRKCDEFVPAAQKAGPHVAPLGIRFYTGKMFPPEYVNRAFVALHGSWNRSAKSGYKVMTLSIKDNKAEKYEVFAHGWLQGQENWGRPVDLLQMPDGALLLSDDQASAVYRISYQK